LAVGLVFGQTAGFDFINLDDNVGIYENPQVTHGLTWDGVRWAFTNRLNCNWDPLTWISHMLDWQVWHGNAGRHHAVNVLLHAATVVLLFLVLRRMSGDVWPSAVAAAVFAIHPLRAESVVWVTERKDVLSGLFFVLTLSAYASYAQRRSIWWYLLLMVLFAIGLLSKPVLVTVPFVLLLLDYWPLGRISQRRGADIPVCREGSGADIPVCREDRGDSGRQECLPHQLPLWRLILEKIPLLVLAAACCGCIYWAERVAEYPHRGAYWRIGNALISYAVYLRQFFWPSELALLYPRRGPELPVWQVVAAGLIVLAITAAVVIWRRKYPYLLVGWLWYLAMMLPMVGLVAFGNEAPADRFTYLPQIGVAVALAWWGADWCRHQPHRRWVYGVGCGAAVLILMGCAIEQASYWRNSETLWRHTLDCTSDNYWVHNLLGNAFGNAGRDEEAERQFRQAARIIGEKLSVYGRDTGRKPQSLEEKGLKQDCSVAYFRLGVTAASQNRMNQAAADYQKAIEIDNDNALAHNNLGYALLVSGEYYEALHHFEVALRVAPEFAAAHFNQGRALQALGHLRSAMAEYREAIRLRSDYADAHCYLGIAMLAGGQREEAIAHFRRALEIKPDYAEARGYLELLLRDQDPRLRGGEGDEER
jgi:tetratricopeptide (TPR) repeat protein